MPHNQDVRKNKLAEIVRRGHSIQTGIRINWEGRVKTFNSYIFLWIILYITNIMVG